MFDEAKFERQQATGIPEVSPKIAALSDEDLFLMEQNFNLTPEERAAASAILNQRVQASEQQNNTHLDLNTKETYEDICAVVGEIDFYTD